MPTTETNEILDAVRDLAPTIAARAEEIEHARRVPPDLVDQLVAAGCFRALVPRSHGGAELELAAELRAIEELGRADGSVAWTVMIGGAAPFLLALLPRATFDSIYAGGPDVILASVYNPTGVATPQPGGFRVSGQWSFASGCQHSHWFLGHSLVDDGRDPPIRMMLLPPEDVEIKDTWAVSGLAGTGSHDVVVTDAFVPDERTYFVGDPPNIDGPIHRVPELALATLNFAAVAVGIAQGALDEVLGLALGKVPAFSSTTLAANPLFQNQLGEADARLRAARALLYADADGAWAVASAGSPFSDEHRARVRATTAWVVQASASVVDAAFTAGGGRANYLSSPLQRRLRDIHALAQHFAIKPDTFTLVGAVLAGQDADLTFL